MMRRAWLGVGSGFAAVGLVLAAVSPAVAWATGPTPVSEASGSSAVPTPSSSATDEPGLPSIPDFNSERESASVLVPTPAREPVVAPAAEPASTLVPVLLLGGVALLAGALGFGAGAWATRRRVGAAGAAVVAEQEADTGPVPMAVPAPEPDAGVRDLVIGLIGSHDLAGDEAGRRHVEQTLRRVGVVAVTPPPGSPVDTHFHEVVAVAATDVPEHVGLVAEVLRPGWTRGPAVLRPAQVRVHAQPDRAVAARPPRRDEEAAPGG